MSGGPAYHGRTHKRGGTDPIDGMLLIGPWITPTLLNSWTDAGAPYCDFQYRWGPYEEGDDVNDAGIEFKGQITGGVTGSVVMQFPTADRFDCDVSFHLPIVEDSEVVIGRADIDSSTGDMTLTFPVGGGSGASALVDLTDVTGGPPGTGEAPVWDGDSFEYTDIATQAELDAHINDTTDAHDASAVSVLDTGGNFTGDDVEEVLAELAGMVGGGGGTIRVPIDLRNPRHSSLAGNSFWTVLGLTDWDAGHWQFLKDVEGKVYGTVAVPANYSSGGAVVLGIAANATSGVTRLQVGTKAVAEGESLNPGSLTDETAQDITVPGTAYLLDYVSFTLTETLAANDLLIVEVFHDGDHANDTLAVNTLLLGAWLEVTV